MSSVASPLVWGLFAALILAVMAIDLGLVRRHAKVVTMKSAAVWVTVWVSMALLFAGFVYHRFGSERALQFLQGWLLEQALSVDNVFVFLIIFSYFKVPRENQHPVLFWGIIGAVVTRGVFIAAGVAIISRFHWVMFILGAFLVYTGGRILLQREEHVDPSRNPVLRLFRRMVPTTADYHGSRFFVREDGRLRATPLLAVLVVVEATDVVFAVDSIPAVLGVTRDPFIVYTSNIFAILGLRSLFFLIEGLMQKLRFLKIGVALILAFIGTKILIEPFFVVPVGISLGVLAGVLALSTLASWVIPERIAHPEGPAPDADREPKP